MPEGDFSAIQPPSCLRNLVIGFLAASVLVTVAALIWGCGSTRAPDPLPRPQPAPQVITDRVPLYDPCPPPPLLPRPMLWPLLVDGIMARVLSVKFVVLESYAHALMAWGDDEAVILEPYRLQATRPPAPPPTPTPHPH